MGKKTKGVACFLVLSFLSLLLTAACSENKGRQDKGAGQAKTDAAGGMQAGGYLRGRVVQTVDAAGYTYVLLDRGGGAQLWVAMPAAKVSIGDNVSIIPGVEMRNFTSNTLKRTFDRIIFSSGMASSAAAANEAAGHMQLSEAQFGGRPHGQMDKKDVHVVKAEGPNGYTIAEIYAKRTALSGSAVAVKGSVVKVSTGIMGKNWIHIQDGSGAQDKGDFDLTVTSQDLPKVGDVVVARGKLTADKDFGAGYRYQAIIEDASIKKD